MENLHTDTIAADGPRSSSTDWFEVLLPRLTERQKQVLELTDQGMNQAAIARELNLSAGRVRQIREVLGEKIKVAMRDSKFRDLCSGPSNVKSSDGL